MLKSIKKYLSNCGRKGGQASSPYKGFGSAEVRAKAEATRAANRARDEQETMRQAVMRATAKKPRKEVYRECD